VAAAPRHPRRLLNLLVRGVIGVVILGIGIGSMAYLVLTRPQPPREARSEPVRLVRVITAERVPVERPWTGYGTARPKAEADIAAEVAATVVERPDRIDPGARLEKGELIVRLDGAEFAARAARAEASIGATQSERDGLEVDEETLAENLRLATEGVALMESELSRLEAALAASGATQVEMERMRRQVTVAKREQQELKQRLGLIPSRRARLDALLEFERANFNLARIDLERTAIRSPVNGTLQDIPVREGERVSPGSFVARVVDLSRIEVPAAIPVAAATQLAPGCRAVLSLPGGVRSWDGTVTRIAPEADGATRTITAYIELEQDPSGPAADLLMPGQFVTATVYSSEPFAGVPVPRGAVSGDRVMVVDSEGRARARTVEIAFHTTASFPVIDDTERQWAVLASGVEPGERLVASNLDDLVPGSRVSATGAGSAPTPARARAALPAGATSTVKDDTR